MIHHTMAKTIIIIIGSRPEWKLCMCTCTIETALLWSYRYSARRKNNRTDSILVHVRMYIVCIFFLEETSSKLSLCAFDYLMAAHQVTCHRTSLVSLADISSRQRLRGLASYNNLTVSPFRLGVSNFRINNYRTNHGCPQALAFPGFWLYKFTIGLLQFSCQYRNTVNPQRRQFQDYNVECSRSSWLSTCKQIYHGGWSSDFWACKKSCGRRWNESPPIITSAPTLSVFRERLQTFLYRRSYTDLFTWHLTFILMYRGVARNLLRGTKEGVWETEVLQQGPGVKHRWGSAPRSWRHNAEYSTEQAIDRDKSRTVQSPTILWKSF